ncbi:MAG TPA: hypothetical protein DCZ75_07435 [Geobacter sp.]|nr:hypothetical protein [Geobacter sp.]
MANSRSPHPLGRDPFQPPTLTPGPLGHNDAASPDTPISFVGDTPGPLGIKDYADPLRRTNREKFRENKKRPQIMKISDLGVRFIWDEEYAPGISERLHWPRGSSGVTLGAGYDMKTRSKVQIANDLVSIGISKGTSEEVAEGAGLYGISADSFVNEHRKIVTLTEEQAIALLKMILPSYEAIVRRCVVVPLFQHEYDALVSFAYNPGGRFRKVAEYVNRGQSEEAIRHISEATTSGGKVLRGLVARRKREVDLYVKGKYK